MKTLWGKLRVEIVGHGALMLAPHEGGPAMP